MLLHWAKSAGAGAATLGLPSSLGMATRQGLLTSFTLACLSARQARGPLLNYAPAGVPALRPYTAFLTAQAAQVQALLPAWCHFRCRCGWYDGC